MNLRQKYKRLKQYVDFAKCAPDEVFIDRTQLEHFRYKANVPLYYSRNDIVTDENSLIVAQIIMKDELAKLLDMHTEFLPDGTISIDIWLKPSSELVKDGIKIVGGE